MKDENERYKKENAQLHNEYNDLKTRIFIFFIYLFIIIV